MLWHEYQLNEGMDLMGIQAKQDEYLEEDVELYSSEMRRD
jgi:hypothetical protein